MFKYGPRLRYSLFKPMTSNKEVLQNLSLSNSEMLLRVRLLGIDPKSHIIYAMHAPIFH